MSFEKPATEAQLDYIRGLGGTPPRGISVSEAHELIEELLKRHKSSANEFATEKQLRYIQDLGGDVPSRLTKSAAAILIQELSRYGDKPTPRQIMILRFWNRMDLATETRNEIAEWQQRFYAENPMRKGAWELYKKQNNDDGTQRDPSWVEIGEGENYVLKVRAMYLRTGKIVLAVIAFVLFVLIAAAVAAIIYLF